MATSSGGNTIFTGSSRYSQDFQNVITRAVAIASLPLQQLNNIKSNLANQSNALTGLDTQFTALQTAVQNLASATGSGSFGATVSDTHVVSVNVGPSAAAGTYSIEVTGLGSSTTALSSDGLQTVTDPAQQNISSASSYTLTVNGTDYTITPAANTLSELAKAINRATGAHVQASIVNVGPSSAPDYRLTIQGTDLNADTIQLSDGSNPLLTTLATGSPATYKVNGLSTPISSTSRTITLAPGVTVDLLKQSTPGSATTITVAQNASGIQNALLSFINAYNSALDELSKQRGEHPGPLAGQSLIGSLSGVLHQLGSYASGSEGVSSLTALGLTYDKTGHLSLDTEAFQEATADGLQPVLDFLGDANSSGFLQAATTIMNGVEDPETGLIKSAINSIHTQSDHEDDLIAQEQDRIDTLQQNLQTQMAAADALIATLEQQVTYMTNLFQTMLEANQKNK